jgi:hypothetical protein
LVKTVKDATRSISQVAGDRGMKPLGETSNDLVAGPVSDPKAVADLMNKLSETKAMLEATRLLMDEAVNKPVIVDWLEGNQ